MLLTSAPPTLGELIKGTDFIHRNQCLNLCI